MKFKFFENVASILTYFCKTHKNKKLKMLTIRKIMNSSSINKVIKLIGYNINKISTKRSFHVTAGTYQLNQKYYRNFMFTFFSSKIWRI